MNKLLIILTLTLFLSGCISLTIGTCGDNILDNGETPETCCLDAGCYGDQICEENICINPSCGECQYIEDYICKDYGCCDDNDCNQNFYCENNQCLETECDYQCCNDNGCDEDEYCTNNECEELDCECDDYENHQCIEYECCEDDHCSDDKYCNNNQCEEVECNCGEIDDHECEGYACCTDQDCQTDYDCIDNECIDEGNTDILNINNVDVLLFTLSSLEQDSEFEDTIEQYIETLEDENLIASFIELDTTVVEDKFGKRVEELDDVKDVLESIINEWDPSFIIILGSEEVVPKFVIENVQCTDEGSPELSSDLWYIDLNNDQIVDSGLTISRIADYGTESENIIEALNTAIELHEQGGLSIEEVAFSGNCDASSISPCYDSPPYCTYDEDDDCYDINILYDLIEENTLIEFSATHGDPSSLGAIDGSGAIIFNVDYFDSLNLNSHQLIVISSGCHAGDLYKEPNFAVELLGKGASIYLARGESYYGTPVGFFEDFYGELDSGNYIGQEFTNQVQDYAESDCQYIASVAHLQFYGDPTIKVK